MDKKKNNLEFQGGQVHVEAIRKGAVQANQGHRAFRDRDRKVGELREKALRTFRPCLQRTSVLHG